jgi:hypothetical protein
VKDAPHPHIFDFWICDLGILFSIHHCRFDFSILLFRGLGRRTAAKCQLLNWILNRAELNGESLIESKIANRK